MLGREEEDKEEEEEDEDDCEEDDCEVKLSLEPVTDD